MWIVFFTAATIVITWRVFRRCHLLHLWNALTKPTCDLNFTPTKLSSMDLATIFMAIIVKSTLSLLGWGTKLERNGDGFELPKITIAAPLEISVEDTRQYEQAIATICPKKEVSSTKKVPSLILAAATTPLMILTLAHFCSPILPLGSVNTKNRFEFLDPEKNNLSKARAIATFGGPNQRGRRTKRGIEFDIIVEVYDTTSEKTIFRQIITVMQTLSKSSPPLYKEPRANEKIESPNFSQSLGVLKVPYSAPSSWWPLCKDYNPIHISAFSARMFGLPGRIAHGNHVVAALLHELIGDSVLYKSSLEVSFRRPMVLPIQLKLKYLKEASTVEFAAVHKEKAYVVGSFGKL